MRFEFSALQPEYETQHQNENSVEVDPKSTDFRIQKKEENQQITNAETAAHRNTIRSRFEKLVLKTAAFGVLFAGTGMKALPVYGHAGIGEWGSQSKAETVIPASSAEREKRWVQRSEPEIRAQLHTAKYEQVFMETPRGLYELFSVGKMGGMVPFTDMQNFMEQHPADSFYLVHTHPAETYRLTFEEFGWSTAQIESKIKQKELPPQPPSMADFFGQHAMSETFKNQKSSPKGKVIDCAGSWEYEVNRDSTFMRAFKLMQEEYSRVIQTELTNTDRAALQKIMKEEDVDERLLVEYLLQKTETDEKSRYLYGIGLKLKTVQTRVLEQHAQTLSIYTAITDASLEIMKSQPGESREKLIQAFTSICKKNGITVVFKSADQDIVKS